MTLNERAELIVHDIKMETETNPIRIFKNIAKKRIYQYSWTGTSYPGWSLFACSL